jgi:6-phosphogluconolactonase
VWMMVSGAEKADAVAAAIGGADPVSVPAAGAVGREDTVWFLDSEAASKLPAGQSG